MGWSNETLCPICIFIGKGKEKKGMEEVLTMVGNFGFPIVVSAYLLVRIEGKLNQLTESITSLSKAIAVLEVRGEKV
jgi:hypothetical protein